MKLFKKLLVVALGLVVIASCNKEDEVSNSSRVQVAVKTSTTTVKNIKAVGVELTTFQINIAEIEFDINDDMEDLLPDGDSTYSDVELEQPFLLDLLSVDASTGIDLAIVDVPNGTYEEIEFEFDVYLEDETKEIYGNTIYAVGTIDGTPFEIKSEEEIEIELEYPGGYVLDGTNSTLFIDLNLDQLKTLVAAIDFTNAVKEEDGSILISKDKNTNILEKFEDAIEDSLEVEEDDEDDEDDDENNS